MCDTDQMDGVILYGIKNCDTVKKARAYLDSRHLDYRFHDFRIDGLTETQLQRFIDKMGIGPLLNTKGTTWKKLSPEERELASNSPETAKALMLQHCALIKRPLLTFEGDLVLLGFNQAAYDNFLQENIASGK